MTPPLLVAHRSGNDPARATRDQHRADAIEADIHVQRGRVVVRHAKVLWPTTRLWERWYLLPPTTEVPDLADVLAAVDDETLLWLDLKCASRRAARRIRAVVPEGRPLLVSSRSWWALGAFRHRPQTRRFRSCGNTLQLRLATRLPGLGPQLGIVANQRLLATGADVASITDRSPLAATWAVTSPQRAEELVEAGITALIVDDLDRRWPRGASSRPGPSG